MKIYAPIHASDVTAVVLTTGSDNHERAVESLKRQTLPPREIIIIRDITPFHKALNFGAAQVKSDFFIQVDSDMVLDPDCLDALRTCMDENTGIAVGLLRDELFKRVAGIKMFRTKCFERVQFKDTISPDTDFSDEILTYGYTAAYALNYRHEERSVWHTFGEHDPLYTPQYTFSKFLLEGRRWRYRKDFCGLQWSFRELSKNKSGVSLFAQIALGHGLCLEGQNDLLAPYLKNKEFETLEHFLKSDAIIKTEPLHLGRLGILGDRSLFKKFYRLGIDMRQKGAFPAFRHYFDTLNGVSDRNGRSAVIATTALCHGLFADRYERNIFCKEYRLFKELLPKRAFIPRAGYLLGKWPLLKKTGGLACARKAFLYFFNKKSLT